jgi:hypothetical protein
MSADRALTVARIGAVTESTVENLGERTFIDEAVFQAASFLRTAATPESRRIIVAITDSWSNQPPTVPHTPADTRVELSRSGAVVCGLVVGEYAAIVQTLLHGRGVGRARRTNPMVGIIEQSLRRNGMPLRDPIAEYADETGGTLLDAGPQDASRRFEEMFDRLRRLYSFGYVSTNPLRNGAYRKLEVKLTAAGRKRVPEGVIRARRGYYAPRDE